MRESSLICIMEETIVSLATSVPRYLIGTHWFYFFVNMEQTHYLDCLFIVILKNMKVRIILKNTKVLKRGMRVGIQSIGAPKRVGYESDSNVLYVYRI